MENYNFNRKTNGITLIALVVSIIVLLILAGISISMLSGENGILKKTTEANEKTELGQNAEIENLQKSEKIINNYLENLPIGNNTFPYLPNNTFSYKEGNLNLGLVIQDSIQNEYVWVEVPTTIYEDTSYNNNGSKKPHNNEDYSNIEACLKAYTNDYKNDNFSDTNPDFITEYQNMLKSVYNNGGFWIGRYEAGLENGINPRTSYLEMASNDKAVVKSNMYPYNYITVSDAQTLATKMNYENCTSSLIFGIQWDLILKYIENKNASTQHNLISDSTEIGNYRNNLWNITNSKAKYSKNSGNTFLKCPYQKTANEEVLLTTGADKTFSLMNIYDLAGNVYEWTLEFYNTSNPFVFRGGDYGFNGAGGPAEYRYGSNTSNSTSNLGFRIGLWK